MTTPDKRWSVDFREVLRAELDHVGDKDQAAATADPIARAHAKQLVGLAFSGGGIRSATFNLGVLQSLARMDLLGKFDYLSTVSGGGYIGGWLLAWMHRRGVSDVRARLRPEWEQQPGNSEAQEIYFLRRFSNYLTPKLGWLGADMWAVIAIYLRNLILNFVMLGSALAVVLLVPRWVVVGSVHGWIETPAWVLALLAGGALFVATYAIARSMRYFSTSVKGFGAYSEENLQPKKGWKDADGNELSEEDRAKSHAPVWYLGELFDDFILRLQFKVTGSSKGAVFVWTPKKADSEKPDVAAAHVIDVASPANKDAPTGTTDGHRSTRRTEVKPGWNNLEIICVQETCTVRVNEITVNKTRIARPVTTQFLHASQRERGAIGLNNGGGSVEFGEIRATKIESPAASGGTQGQVQRWIILPLFIAAFIATFLFDYVPQGKYPSHWGWLSDGVRGWLEIVPGWDWWICALLSGGGAALFLFAARVFLVWRRKDDLALEFPNIWRETLSITVAASAGGVMARALYSFFSPLTLWEVTIWGTPALIGVFLVTIIFDIGLLGRRLPDQQREWWGRLNAWLLIYTLGWIAIFGVAFYAPILLEWLKITAHWALSVISLTWVASTVSGLLAARGASTGREKSNKLVEVVAKVAPYVFVAGFFIFLACAVDAVLPKAPKAPVANQSAAPNDLSPSATENRTASTPTLAQLTKTHWQSMDDKSDPGSLLLVTAVALAASLVLSWRLDINQFSMHMLYRNRLGRCYLGASNSLRQAQPFTGFSADDDITLTELWKKLFEVPGAGAPYPIINAALNLVGGKELAWQQRKAASFVFTPRYCGYEFPELPPGYCLTQEFASVPNPVTLATAMAISGAAASPNMGYHTSPAPAFLMTVFNVRLGWWLGNPRQKRGYEKSGPLNVLGSLVCELFGLTSDEGKYVYLSDGGHFENLGIYELVRRRCRFIVACDGEEDRKFGFGGLGNAIEKCRSDFGIDIDIDVEPIRRLSEEGHSEWHCAIGKIFYSRADPDARDGTLIYLKSSLTGDEPTDVLRYAAANAGFPHQSTGDQWFDESQFESYRVLGFHVAENVFGAVGTASKLAGLSKEQLFVELAQEWHPPSVATAESFTKHTRNIVALYDELRENKHLAFLSEYIYPEWRVLFNEGGFAMDTDKPLRAQLPKTPEQLRAGFYICNSAFQLFEDAYVDLHLEEEFDHPDNRGWMNLFKHWSWAPILRVTWTMCAGNYGARFQRFCEQHLGLSIGDTEVRPVGSADAVEFTDPPTPFPWNGKLGGRANQIARAIWDWLAELPVGSPVIADAVLTANIEAPGSRTERGGRMTPEQEAEALREAARFIDEALERLDGKHIARTLPTKVDEEWHAAATLLELTQRNKIPDELKVKWAAQVAKNALSHATIITERLTGEVHDELNPVERDLVELFFIFNPGLAATARISRLEVTPDPNAPNATVGDRNLHFPFGFAILANVRWPEDINAPAKLVYFRVQDHLRRMGLARKALRQMIDKNPALEVEPRTMHPEACEVPTENDRTRFIRLFDSVKNVTRQ